MNCDIWIISNRSELAEETKNVINHDAKIFNGDGYDSFTVMINECINMSENEIIIISNDKARPLPEHIDKIINLLNDGYGIVGLFRFGFFGFKKDLIRKIGFFDERFIGGGYEDDDMIIRTKEANISHYMIEEIPYVYIPTSWKYATPDGLSLNMESIARKHFYNKWLISTPHSITRLLSEEDYSNKYNMGEYQSTIFLPFDKSVMCRYCDKNWIEMNIIDNSTN